MMRAGPLRHRVEIRIKDETIRDRIGGQSVRWRTLARVMAQITPISGGEQLRSAQVDSKTTHRIWMRYRDGITSKHQILYGNRQFNIRSVINRDERDRMLEIMCEEGAAQ
jgi:SPP1 family predicted phage head-tail adaptor